MTNSRIPPVAEFTALIVGGLALQAGAVVFAVLDDVLRGHVSRLALVAVGLVFAAGAVVALVGLARLLREVREFLAEWRWSRAEQVAGGRPA